MPILYTFAYSILAYIICESLNKRKQTVNEFPHQWKIYREFACLGYHFRFYSASDGQHSIAISYTHSAVVFRPNSEMIEVFKVLHEIYDKDITLSTEWMLNVAHNDRTRDKSLKLSMHCSMLNHQDWNYEETVSRTAAIWIHI